MTTTIKGTPRQFCVDELQVRQRKATKAYLETSQSLYRLYSNDYADFFNSYGELILEGYRLAVERLPDLQPSSYTIYLRKPASVLDAEVLELEAKVKQAYITELELERTEYEAKLVAQMLAADEAKELKALEIKKAKKLEEFKALAAKTYSPLTIPN